MKNSKTPRLFSRLTAVSVSLLTLSVAPALFAVDASWTGGGGNALWSTAANWSASPVPGTGNTATFNAAGNTSFLTLDLGAGGVTVSTMLFDTASAAGYTIGAGTVGSQTLNLNDSGAITLNSTVANSQLFNSTITLGTAITGTYTITQNATTPTLTLAGNVQGGTGGTAAAKTLTVTGTGNTTISGNLANGGALSLALTKTGTGTLTLSGTDTFAGIATISAGIVNLTGTINSGSTSGGVTVGTASGNTAVLKIANNLTANNLLVGGNTTGNGAVYQTAGTVSFGQAAGDLNLSLGSTIITTTTGGYGYYGISGGTLGANLISVGGRTAASPTANAYGVMDVSGGTVNSAGFVTIGRSGAAATSAGAGVLNVTGGTVNGAVSTVNSGLFMGYSAATDVVNVGGGASAAAISLGGASSANANSGVDVANQNISGGTTVINLLANGTMTTPNIHGSGANNVTFFNFNGGTLKASSVNWGTTFMTSANIDNVVVYSGGGTVDNNGTAITISRPMTPPTGNGVATIPVSNGGAGYIGAPIVSITGGGGSGATAYAQFNPASGLVTGIVVTSPGSGYTSAPTVTLIGGGATSAATIGIVTTAANNTSGGMTFADSGSAATTTLSAANTYTGTTIISGGTLKLDVAGSLASGNISIGSGATFDVSSQTTPTLAANQKLSGTGNVNGSLTTVATTTITPATDGTTGTLTFNNNLTLNAGTTFKLDLSSTSGGANDKVVLSGSAAVLTANGAGITINSAGTLDTTTDYVLIDLTGATASISGIFNTTPTFVGTTPAGAVNYSIVTTAKQVKLHYNPVIPPTISAQSATSAARGQTSLLTATVTANSGTVTGVGVDASSISAGGVALISNGAGSYTNAITVPAGTAIGNYSLTVNATNSTSGTSFATIALAVTRLTETWNGAGANDNWSSAANWASALAPLTGDNLAFAGSTRTSPVMESSYSVNAVAFNSGASSFNITTPSGTLTLVAGVTNNSAAAQSLNVPVSLGAAQTFNAAAGDLSLGGSIANGGFGLTVAGISNTVASGAISGSGGLTKIDNGALTLSGGVTLTGNPTTTVSGGKVSLVTSAFSNGGTDPATAGGQVNVGVAAANRAVLNIAANVNAGELRVGGGSTGAGAVYQTGGTAVFGSTSPVSANLEQIFSIGASALNGTPGYGYYKLSGGSVTARHLSPGGAVNGAVGVVDVTGGTLGATEVAISLGRGSSSSGTGSSGLLNITGGSVTNIGNLQFYGDSSGVATVANVGGGTGAAVYSGPSSPTVGILLGITTSGTQNNHLNLLNNGTVSVGKVAAFATAPNTFVNFNGGTLKASAVTNAGASFFVTANNVDTAVIYSGGGTIDNNSTAITIGQPILAATGSGVTTIAVATKGSGYIGAPIVSVTGGTTAAASGGGATAVANMLDDGTGNGTFMVDSITVTTPGVYSSVAGITVTLLGGGATSTATIGTITTGANINGGMTFQGSGTTTLSNTANTYTGNTTISAGGLALSGSSSLSSTNIVIGGGAIFDVSGLSSTFVLGGSQTLSNSTVNAVISGTNNTGSGTLSLVCDGVNPSFTITNGGMTISSSTVINVNNTGATLTPGTYKIISKATAGNVGLVAGTVPSSVTVVGGPAAGTPSLSIVNGELYLTVGGASSWSYTGSAFTYNGSAQTPPINFSGSIGPKTTNYVGTGYASVNAPTNAGTYYVSNTVAADANYFGTTNSQSFTISAKAASVTADTQSKTYGTANPTLTATVLGTVHGDTLNYSLATDATQFSSVGTSNITVTLGSNPNYSVLATNSTLTITPASIAIVVNSSANPSGYKDAVSFIATLPADATGSVVFSSANGSFSTNTVGGVITTSLALTDLPRGTNLITVSYSGDGNYVGSTNSIVQTVTNHLPTASTMLVTRTAGLSLKIALSDLATNWSDVDGDSVSLASLNLTTTNGVSLVQSNGWIYYPNAANVADQISYTLSDGQGGTNMGYVNVTVSFALVTGQTTGITVPDGNTAVVSFAGISDYAYQVQRSTNLTDWVTLTMTNTPAGGLFNYTDTFGDLGGNAPTSVYYRLGWNPNP